MQLFAFLLDEKDLTGTNCETRIDEIVAMGSKATQTYKLKDTTGKFNMNAKRFNEDQIEYIKTTLGEQLYFYGYSNHPDNDPDHQTAFFDFGSEHDPKHVEAFNGFRKVN